MKKEVLPCPLINIGDIAMLQKEAPSLGYNLLAYAVHGHYWSCVLRTWTCVPSAFRVLIDASDARLKDYF